MTKKSFKERVEQTLGKFAYIVLSILLEWIMIAILFIDGLIAFLANEFARFFELKIPCLLCTRIDHVLVRRDPDFYYNDSVCEAHRKDVSSLAYCHLHGKLSDVRKMCEGCLLSFATENKSNRETYRSLVGLLGADMECSVEEDHKIHLRLPADRRKDQGHFVKSNIHHCSCCGEPLRIRSSFQQPLLQGQTSNAVNFPQAPLPTPRRVLTRTKSHCSRSIDPLPHIRYTELKFTSDTESEVPDEDTTGKEDTKGAPAPLLTDSEDSTEEVKTPCCVRASRLLNLAMIDSAIASPRAPERLFRRLLAEKPGGSSEFVELNMSSETDCSDYFPKRVRLDRESMMALYMVELEAERSASAVAANQAMAMITRLQEEKAAMQMEALQYQRMMEEQAEYDQEALQDFKDLLAKKNEEIKMLEAELRSCKQRLGEDVDDIEELKARSSDDDYQLMSHPSISQMSECGSPRPNFYDEVGNGTGSSQGDGPGSYLDQESERLYLLERLRVLEKIHASKSVDHSDFRSYDIDHLEEECRGEGGNAILNREISNLRKRLEAIENDREFLKHAVQSLQKGDEGTQLLMEIAQHLRELRHAEKMNVEQVQEKKVVMGIESS